MKYIVGGAGTFTIAEHDTSSGAIDPDAASARGALTVAASNYATPDTPEAFSSRGPAFKLFDVAGTRLATPDDREKPDLAAADGIATSVAGFNPFSGTSAAAPSAAGIAALMLSANPTLPVNTLAAILKNASNTIDCTATIGLPDRDCGYGFVLADGAVRSALTYRVPRAVGDADNHYGSDTPLIKSAANGVLANDSSTDGYPFTVSLGAPPAMAA